MHCRHFFSLVLGIIIFSCCLIGAFGQEPARSLSDTPAAQRLTVMHQRLEAMRRSLNNAIASMNAGERDDKQKNKASADDPRERLRGLEKEVASVLNDVNDIRNKQDRFEKYDSSIVDKLETSVGDLDTRVQSGLSSTAGARAAGTVAASNSAGAKKKKKGRFLGLFGRGGEDKYAELTGTAAAGRDRVLFEEAAKQVRKGNHEEGRLLFNTIITTYPDSPYLPLAKLAIADSFYLEGSTSGLIQASNAYQDWVTFFPTDPLADRAMLKVAEAEMRQMNLPNRDFQHSRKAEQRLKVLLQQYPTSPARSAVEEHLREVQENLAMHNLGVAQFYLNRYQQDHHKGGLKGGQSRLREITEKYPNFSYMDEVLYRLGATYLEEEEPDEAAKFFQQIARDYPNSEYAAKSRDQLKAVGAQVPEPDPVALKKPTPVRPKFTEKLITEVLGRVDVNVDKDGVLISRDGKAGKDLIDQAIQHNGQLPATAPIYRTPPARTSVQPASTQGGSETKGRGISVKPASGPTSPDNLIKPAVPGPPAAATGQPPPSSAATPPGQR